MRVGHGADCYNYAGAKLLISKIVIIASTVAIALAVVTRLNVADNRRAYPGIGTVNQIVANNSRTASDSDSKQ